MLKVLLIQPPVEDFYDTDIRLQPLGLCYLKAAVLRYCPGVEVVVKDYHHGWGRQTIRVPKELAYLKNYYSHPNQSPFSSFYQYFHFGASYSQIAEEIADEKPDLVGISSLFAPYYREVLQTAAAIKNEINVPIVIGGGHATSCPELMLDNDCIDFVIRGEGEKAFVELIGVFDQGKDLSGVGGLGYKKQGKLVFNPITSNFPLNEIAVPDYTDFPLERYQYKNEPIIFMQSSRGCPHSCSFCSVHQVFGKKYRRRSPESIVCEMDARYEQGYRVFDFEDDNLTYNKKEIMRLCHLIEQKIGNKNIKLLAMNGVSYQSLDSEIMSAMRKAGFYRLNLALVSGNQEVLQSVNRHHDVEKLKGVVESAHALGFSLEVHVIIGLPGDTVQNMMATISQLAQLPVLIGVSTFYLTPQTPVAESFDAMGPEDIFKARSTAMAIVSDDCSRRDLFTLFAVARIINFLKSIDAPDGSSLQQLIDGKNIVENRANVGIQILKRLFTEKKLFAFDKKSFHELKQFNVKLFDGLWNKLDTITTQSGKKISIKQSE